MYYVMDLWYYLLSLLIDNEVLFEFAMISSFR
jgi:hypothetical protein